jgi:hypothetical protein
MVILAQNKVRWEVFLAFVQVTCWLQMIVFDLPEGLSIHSKQYANQLNHNSAILGEQKKEVNAQSRTHVCSCQYCYVELVTAV